MARKPRQRRRMNQDHRAAAIVVDDKLVNIRKISSTDEGVLYTMQISPKRPRRKSIPSSPWWSIFGKKKSGAKCPNTSTLRGQPSVGNFSQNAQFTIAKKAKYNNPILNWLDSLGLNFFIPSYVPFISSQDVDSHLYRPSNFLYRYINWTFRAGFTSVFTTFLLYYFIITLAFGLFLFVAGNAHPECITSGGDHFGANPYTKFNDAYHLSWTTFTTVGYGNGYTSTANDLVSENGTTMTEECAVVVLLCNAEAFIGLLYAGMCGAILFGKVNRVQSHAKLIFANAVCLQYEQIEEDDCEDTETDGSGRYPSNGEMKSRIAPRVMPQSPVPLPYNSNGVNQDEETPTPERSKAEQFVDQYNGCPVLKFQVVNEMCNSEGSELVDAIMKVIGIKFSGNNGRITHSQYVRVNLVDFEHPFFSRVWHGVHILDSTSPLLTEKAKRKIKQNHGSWPTEWFDPDIIKNQLEFNDLVVTVAGISNVSAITVHAYKRYKVGDVLIGFNFVPLVFRDSNTGSLEVDLSLCHDVREQRGGGSEDLMKGITSPGQSPKRAESNICIMKSSDGIEDMESQSQDGSQHEISEISELPVEGNDMVEYGNSE